MAISETAKQICNLSLAGYINSEKIHAQMKEIFQRGETMIINKMENGVWTSIDTERNEVLCTIESLGNHIYKATNSFLKITAEVFPIDEYRTSVKCIENKNRTKNGIYRKSRKLLDSNMKWLVYMLEECGFIRKPKTIS